MPTEKVSKNLWISAETAEIFDAALDRLSKLLGERVDAGELGSAAILHFVMETADRQLLTIRNLRVLPLDRVIAAVRRGEIPPPLSEDMVTLLQSYLKGRQVARTAAHRATQPGKVRKRSKGAS